jgi:hypothetical protein
MQNFENLISVAQNIPGKLKDNALTLIEQMSAVIEGIGDEPVVWKPSFLRLVQGTTDRGSIPKGTGIGEFVLGEEKVEQPLHFIPIRLWDARQYWDPDQTSNKMLCWSPDAKLGSMFGDCKDCQHSKWVDGEGQDCGKIKTAMVISSDMSKVFTIQFGKSNYKVGTELEGLLKKAGVPPYYRTFGLVSATSSTAKNVENYKIEVLDDKLRKTPEHLLPFLKELFNMINSDRKASLDQFYENTRHRQEQLALSGNSPIQIGNKSSSEVPADIPAVVNTAAVSDMALGYKV